MDSHCLTARPDMSTIDTRHEQMFPKLMPREIDGLRRFGEIRHYSAGEALFVTGDVAPGMYVLIRGSVRVIRRDPLGHTAPIVEQGPGEFVAEVGQLSGQPAFVDVRAIDDVEALLIPPENVRALMIAEPELGERIMRPLILPHRRDRDGCRWSGLDRLRIQSGRDPPAKLPGPQCVSASIARPGKG
jgi:hypothetical protein